MTRNDRRPNARRFASPKFVREGGCAYTSFFTGKPHVAGGCPQDMLALNDASDNRGELRVYVDASASWRVLGHAFLMRNYRAGLGKWPTADPLGYPDGQLASANYGVTSAVDLWGCELKVVDNTTESVPYEPSHLHDKGIHTHIVGEYDGRKCHWYVIDLYERDVVVLQDHRKKRKWEEINGLENILNGMGYGLDISGGYASLTGVGIIPAGGLLLGGVLCHTVAEIVNLLNSWVEVPLGKPITLKGEPYKKIRLSCMFLNKFCIE